jgi:stearoyl-CoA desaturase (Delta-9 desaturase)
MQNAGVDACASSDLVAAPPHPPQGPTAAERMATLIAVVVPFLGLVAAMVFLWGRGFSWIDLGLLLGMYALTVLGVTVGFHRYFTHRSFETGRVMQFALGALGSMAVEGPLLKWVALHRRHHQYSDQPDDPHSPCSEGRGFRAIVRGMWHAHMGWFFRPEPPGLDRYVKDLRQSAALRAASALFPVWVLVGLLIPSLIGWALEGDVTGALMGFIWGGLTRIFLVHHVTWCINSVCHLWGGRSFASGDQSRNNFLLGLLAFGEGWHNNHHAFPTSARHGFSWWQIDISYWVIRTLALLGLVWKIRVPSPATLLTPREQPAAT